MITHTGAPPLAALMVAGSVGKENVGNTFMELVRFVDHDWRVVELP